MRKKKLKIVPIVLVATTLCLFMAGCGSSSDAQKVGEVSSTPSAATPSNEASQAPSTPASSEPESQQTEFHVGDILQADGLSIVYAASGEYISDNQFMQPKDGNKYIFIELAVENTSSSDKSISYFNFDCYADGYDCESFYGADDTLSASLSTGRSTSGKVCFEVPIAAKEIEIEYEYNLFSNKKAIFIYEGEKDSGYVFEGSASASSEALSIGDVIEANGLKITYLSCQVWDSGNQFITPKDGCEFIACEFEFENTGSSDQMISTFEFECYADGQCCDQSYYNDNDISSVTLSSGRKAKGTVTFEVPAAASVVELEYNTNVFTSSHVIFTIR